MAQCVCNSMLVCSGVLADMCASQSLRPFPLLCVREGAWSVFACARHLCVRAFVSGCAAMSSVTGNECTEMILQGVVHVP